MTVQAHAQPTRSARGPVHATERALAPDLARGAMLLLIALANAAGVFLASTPGIDPTPQGLDAPTTSSCSCSSTRGRCRCSPSCSGTGWSSSPGGRPRRAPRRERSARCWCAATPGCWSSDSCTASCCTPATSSARTAWSGSCSRCPAPTRRPHLPHRGVVRGLRGPLRPRPRRRGGARHHRRLGSAAGVPTSPFASVTAASYPESVLARLTEWPATVLTMLPFILFVWMGAWAARRRILEEPARHRRLLRWARGGRPRHRRPRWPAHGPARWWVPAGRRRHRGNDQADVRGGRRSSAASGTSRCSGCSRSPCREG